METDKYRLLAKFDSVAGSIAEQAEFLIQKSTPSLAGPSPNGNFASAAQSGADVTADPAGNGNERLLWFDLRTPAYTTTESQKGIAVTVSIQ